MASPYAVRNLTDKTIRVQYVTREGDPLTSESLTVHPNEDVKIVTDISSTNKDSGS